MEKVTGGTISRAPKKKQTHSNGQFQKRLDASCNTPIIKYLYWPVRRMVMRFKSATVCNCLIVCNCLSAHEMSVAVFEPDGPAGKRMLVRGFRQLVQFEKR